MKKSIYLIVVLSFVMGIVGCGSAPETVQSTEDKPVVSEKTKKVGAVESDSGL